MSPTITTEPIEPLSLGRRIGEIMEERGEAYSLRAFGHRIGLSKDILSRCINGERYIKPSELEKIADGLSLSIDRLKETDTKRDQEELSKLLKSMKNPKRALELAEKLASLAIGITEKSRALNDLGRAYFVLQKHENAHKTWLQAYDHAQQVADKYKESDILYKVLTNLMISFSVRKEYSKLEEIIDRVGPLFYQQPDRTGAICYSVAMIAYDRKQFDLAKEKLYESLDHYSKTQDAKSIGVAQRNVAYIEYKLKNYKMAKQYYELAIENLADDAYWKLVAVKDYVKCLIKMGKKEQTEYIIQSSLKQLCDLSYPDLEGKFYLLLSLARNETSLVESLLDRPIVGKSVQSLACKYLLNHFSRVGDAASLLKYYKISEGLLINHSDILEEDSL